MKLRFDFVSNSSSSSFVLKGGDVAKGIHLLKRVVKSCEVPWEVENEITLHVYALNKNMPELAKMLDDDSFERGGYGGYHVHFGDRSSSPPDELSWHSIEVSLSKDGIDKLTDEALEKIDYITFYLSDGHTLTLMLKLLYLFFQKNGCCPDASDTEQDFMCTECKEDFMYALACGLPEGKPEENTDEQTR